MRSQAAPRRPAPPLAGYMYLQGGTKTSYNETGGAVSTTSQGLGEYAVVFHGLGGIKGGNVQVTPATVFLGTICNAVT